MTYLAHSKNSYGHTQSLSDHLTSVADLAAGFAAAWGGGDLAHLAGLLHDLGKVSPVFQEYVRGQTPRGGDHSTFGACLSMERCELLAFPLAGHHAGIADRGDLKARLKQWAAEALSPTLRTAAEQLLPGLSSLATPGLPPHASSPRETELLIRMLFSTLVDADFLDTEHHFQEDRAGRRRLWPPISELAQRFSAAHSALSSQAVTSPLNAVRNSIYEQCLAASEEAPGFFGLTVPTGGGKTLSAMGFALAHALRWGMNRVLVVIPFTSIVEQTADVYRSVLGSESVLEHHSAIQWSEVEDLDRERQLLASENWDAPVVVTTTVQFLESLHSNRSAACRKLHNIAGSVVILDEVQTIPTSLLLPTFDMLRSLVRYYAATVVLSTATHPDYQAIWEADAPPIHQMVASPEALFQQLRRVNYILPRGNTLSWDQVAQRACAAPQSMVVLNTRSDAREVYTRLPEETRLHLSTNLCGDHRRQVLAQVRERLAQGKPCHLATTQLIEAGVDVDFPLVLRAVAPLDRLVQAAGRCNREGRLEAGEVVIFEPADGHLPPRAYLAGTDTARTMLAPAEPPDLHSPALYEEYFRRLYQSVPLDEQGILRDREDLKFETVARNFRVIDDDTTPVVVPWGEAEQLLDTIERRREGLTRDDLRALQPYFVSLRSWEFQEAVEAGQCLEVLPGVWRWEGGYDPDLGLLLDAQNKPTLIY